jgi:hypothetical protein
VPLDTTWTAPLSCSIAVQDCRMCSKAWVAQTLFREYCYGQCHNMALKIEDNPDCWPPRGSFIGTLTLPLVGWGFLFSRSGLLEWCLRVLQQKVVLRGVTFNPIFWQRRRLWDIVLTAKPVQNLRSNTDSPHYIGDIRISTVFHKRAYRLQPRLPFKLWHANPELADIFPTSQFPLQYQR